MSHLQAGLVRSRTERCNRQLLFHQVLCVRKLAIVEVHVALRRRNVGVPEQAAGVFDPLFAADFGPAFVAGQITAGPGALFWSGK